MIAINSNSGGISMINNIDTWLMNIQEKITSSLEAIEDQKGGAKFQFKEWTRENHDGKPGGGGRIGSLKGEVFEKAAVNYSSVFGSFPPQFAKEVPGADKDPTFHARGVSVVIHPKNPYVPIAHFNVRKITTSQSWVGGGMDLTPVIPFEEDTELFHTRIREMCDKHHPDYYAKFKKWCDEYFYISHRKEPRGVGGIFFDNHSTDDPQKDLLFLEGVADVFATVYPEIVLKRLEMTWGEEELKKQAIKRARYVEFNLIYDRGTRFGLQIGGNTEGILMSMPPNASWQI